jgi:hypothetical protein
MKKQFYVFCTVVLGILLSYVAHAYIEIFQLDYDLRNGITPINHSLFGANCFLPVSVQVGLLVIGIVGGYVLGQTWWGMVYVEKRWKKWVKTRKSW